MSESRFWDFLWEKELPTTAKCHLCGSSLVKTTISKGNASGIALALVVLFIGILILLTGWGAIIGIPLCICALFMGGRRIKVLRCPKCGATTEAS